MPRFGVAGQGVAVAAADAGRPAPGGCDEGLEAPPGLAAEQRDELVDGVIEAGGRTALRDHPGALAAEKALDRRPAERPDIIGGRSRIARIAQDVGLVCERALADHFQIKLLVAAEWQDARRLAP